MGNADQIAVHMMSLTYNLTSRLLSNNKVHVSNVNLDRLDHYQTPVIFMLLQDVINNNQHAVIHVHLWINLLDNVRKLIALTEDQFG
jgi:hypothetical protein